MFGAEDCECAEYKLFLLLGGLIMLLLLEGYKLLIIFATSWFEGIDVWAFWIWGCWTLSCVSGVSCFDFVKSFILLFKYAWFDGKSFIILIGCCWFNKDVKGR